MAQKESCLYTLYGYISDKEKTKPVQYAHIINKNSYYTTISDTSGNFKIHYTRGDTLIISCIGYKKKEYIPEKYQKVVIDNLTLEPTSYQIARVKVRPWGDYRDVKYDFMNLSLNDPKENLHPLVWNNLSLFPNRINKSKKPEPVGGPISLIYSLVNKEERAKRKVRELKEMETKMRKIRSKYNKKIVGEIVGLKGKELDKFFKFCNFTDNYLLKNKKIDILHQVKEKYKTYSARDCLKNQK